jgi:osmotically-inducible protein OsmY
MQTQKKSDKATLTDAQIARDVLHRMKEDFEVPDDRIRIKVADGIVTVEGTVHRDSQKAATESCAKRVKGVRGVVNKIEVAPFETSIEAR